MLMNFFVLFCAASVVLAVVSMALCVRDMLECDDYGPLKVLVGFFIALLLFAAILDYNGIHLA